MKKLLVFGSSTLIFGTVGFYLFLRDEGLLYLGVLSLILALVFAGLTIYEAISLGRNKEQKNRSKTLGIIIFIVSVLCIVAAIILTAHSKGITYSIGWIISACCGIVYITYVICTNEKKK